MTDLHSGASNETDFLHRLKSHCEVVQFSPGSIIREKGQHYTSMFIITDGQVEVDLEFEGGVIRPEVKTAGLPIGEFGFLHGHPANATVKAITETRGLEINDQTISAVTAIDTELAVALLRHLGNTAEERTSQNIALTEGLTDPPKEPEVRILLCRDEDMLFEAKRLRYEVYCEELGRTSPHADHDNKTISDHFDDFGQTFIAVKHDKTIGTLRANRPIDGPIGMLEILYGMTGSKFHPESTVVCTKFVIAPNHRTSSAGIKLVAGFANYGIQNQIRECYIDCIPSLRPFYMAMGFRKSGEKFLHQENGPSIPMKIDLVKYKGRMERVLSSLD